MQTITLEGVKSAARKFYRKKRLTAQHPKKERRDCVYRSGDYRCAIGAALSVKTLDKISDRSMNSEAGLSKLFEEKIIDFDGSDIEREGVSAIQGAHDIWATHSKNNGALYSISIEKRNKFLALIGIEVPA